MPAPMQVDTVTFSDTTDFAALVREVLAGGGGVSALPSDAQPLDWVFRAYQHVRGTDYADRLSRGVADCLTAPEPEIRGQALVFFQSQPRAAGGERVRDLVAGDRRLFRGVADPIHPGTDLDWQLLAALAARIALGDQQAVDLGRAEAQQPGRAAPLIGELATADQKWVVANAEAIVRATPAAGATLLVQLQTALPAAELVALGRRIVPLSHGDPRFEGDVSRFVDDRAVRQQLLDLFHRSTPS